MSGWFGTAPSNGGRARGAIINLSSVGKAAATAPTSPAAPTGVGPALIAAAELAALVFSAPPRPVFRMARLKLNFLKVSAARFTAFDANPSALLRHHSATISPPRSSLVEAAFCIRASALSSRILLPGVGREDGSRWLPDSMSVTSASTPAASSASVSCGGKCQFVLNLHASNMNSPTYLVQ
eukprot:SAG31_NODE_1742_length_7385_cov_40.678836_4_plen_182_part_00